MESLSCAPFIQEMLFKGIVLAWDSIAYFLLLLWLNCDTSNSHKPPSRTSLTQSKLFIIEPTLPSLVELQRIDQQIQTKIKVCDSRILCTQGKPEKERNMIGPVHAGYESVSCESFCKVGSLWWLHMWGVACFRNGTTADIVEKYFKNQIGFGWPHPVIQYFNG